MRKITRVTLITLGAVLVLALLIGALIKLTEKESAEYSNGVSTQALVVREDSHVLDFVNDDSVTVVEFLDFECEACGAFYPIVEQIREKFSGKINYVVRYFPIPGHVNSMNAAIAAEAAAQQGRFEDMFHQLFSTQKEWGEARESKADYFRSLAEGIGLNMADYDKSVADPATAFRIQSDFEEGKALGIRSTPTFFIDGEMLELEAWTDLESRIAEAVR